MDSARYFVNHQISTYTGIHYVEISIGPSSGRYGGLDYSNPGMLDTRAGKKCATLSSNDPREAVKFAIAERDAMRKHLAQHQYNEPIEIYKGCTGGSTCFFCDVDDPTTDAELIAWADAAWAELPKCDQCGDLLPSEYYYNDDPEFGKYCREYCAEQAAAHAQDAEAE